jgi:large subunit ribosomal protein L25
VVNAPTAEELAEEGAGEVTEVAAAPEGEAEEAGEEEAAETESE